MSLQHVEAGKLGGRPPLYETHEAFETAVDAYFADCKVESRPFTMSGLANALGMSRVTLMQYEHRDPRFTNTVKRARAKVEQQLEEGLLTRERQVAGHIFNLKNNFGWKDVQEVEHTHTLVMLGTGDSPLQPPAITSVGEGRTLSAASADSAPIQIPAQADIVSVSGETT